VRVDDGGLADLHELAAQFEVGYRPRLFKSLTSFFLLFYTAVSCILIDRPS